MKPHLKLIDGFWFCAVKPFFINHWGVGYTPIKAYDDWLFQELKT